MAPTNLHRTGTLGSIWMHVFTFNLKRNIHRGKPDVEAGAGALVMVSTLSFASFGACTAASLEIKCCGTGFQTT